MDNEPFQNALLAPFGEAEAEEFLDVLLGATAETVSVPSLQALKQQILQKTEGSPFFMEEVVQELFEQGILVRNSTVGAGLALSAEAAASSSLTISLHLPTTVQDILAARIDRLTLDEKTLLQQLAVIGREFPLSLVEQVIVQPEGQLSRLLASLQYKEFLYEQPAFPEVEYIFKHALTQEVAYNTLLLERRKALHEQTGQTIEALYRDRLDEHNSELAHHYTRSGNTEKAIAYLHKAGQQATLRSANGEAISHLTTALELIKTLPDTLERSQQELAIHVSLGPALISQKGFTDPEVERAYARAYELCLRCERPDQLIEALAGLRAFHLVRGEIRKAREVAEQRWRLAQHISTPNVLMLAHVGLGESLLYLGEVTAAHEHFLHAWKLYHPQEYDLNVIQDEEDPGMWLLSRLALTLRALGYPEQAQKRLDECLALAERQALPFGLVFALGSAGWFHADRGEWQRVRERAEEMIRLVTKQGFPFFLAYGTAMQGWALAEQGQGNEGIVQLQQGLASLQDAEAELGRLDHLPWLATAYGKVGRVEEGLAVLAEALAVVNRTEARVNEAELYRLRGELTLAREGKSQNSKGKNQKSENPNLQSQSPDPHTEAEACFLKAIEIAKKQQAKSLELRAAMSFARLWQQQATQRGSSATQHETRVKLDAAHRMLSEVYNWFTEGFDTKDLQEAKTLIEELRR